jgi:uncharacterized membrane protein SirB2
VISYEVYKVIHLFCIGLLLTSFTVAFFTQNKFKVFKVLSGVATLLVLVSGMGLMARLGIAHGSAWPQWIYVKFFVWFMIGIGGAMVAKRFSQYGPKAYVVMMSLFFLAALSAVLKF